MIEIQRLEQAAANALPPATFQLDEGWRLRLDPGGSRRANSVLAEHHLSSSPLAEKIERAEAFYTFWGKPARFQLCAASQPSGLDEALASRGYRRVGGASVQHAPLTKVLGRLVRQAPPETTLDAELSANWFNLYTRIVALDTPTAQAKRTLFQRIPAPTAFVTAYLNGVPAAVGLGVLERTQLGLFNMATLPGMRRRGAARSLVHALAIWGAYRGADGVYLQAAEENTAARTLYAQLGFETRYTYHYREAP